MVTRRATQRDIALQAGVGRSTVSLALKGHPKISPDTRSRIMQVAESLHYSPDPMLSALATYRNRVREKAFHGTLAWLVNAQPGYDWETGPYYAHYYSGAAERASSYGYRLEKFALNANGITRARLQSILRARNVGGLLLCPQPRAGTTMDFAWDDFASVTFGYSLASPLLHTVASAHFLNTRHVVRELAARGYTRIGLVIDRTTDRRCGSNVYAGFLVEQELDERLETTPAFLDHDPVQIREQKDYGRKLHRYIEENRLDAILTSDYRILEILDAEGLRSPTHVGVAGVSLPTADTALAGVVEDSTQIGAVAMDLLVGMVQRGEKGIPNSPIRTHLEGIWHEGQTLNPRREALRPNL
jgi:LacI family transcriptional regulator/LacI family repressor for deo operon, udp, cdd, tsx, nupC, and nupG